MTSSPAQSPFAIARYFLERAEGDGTPDVTPMKLMKLAYIAHGWVLCFTDAPLLAEPVQAWKFGPVVPSLYHYFKRHRDAPIPFAEIISLPPFAGDERTTASMDGVWGAYKNHSGIQLSALTHQQGTPWHETWFRRGGRDKRGATIDDLLIRDYYAGLLEQVSPEAEEAAVAPA